MIWKGWIAVILGLWLLLELFIGSSPDSYSLNYFFVGLLLLGISLFTQHDKPWQVWIPGFLGFWLIIAGIIPVLVSGIGHYLNSIIVGLLITGTGLAILVHKKKLIHYVKKIVKHPNFRNYGSE